LDLTELDRKRMVWHSRRGMLELDLILVPFAQNCLPLLSMVDQNRYRQLLALEDQDLFVWLTRRELAPTAELRELIDLILASRRAEIPDQESM
jgi:antitoxin CptB